MGDHVGAELADRVAYLLGEIEILVADAYQQLDQQRKALYHPSCFAWFCPVSWRVLVALSSPLRRGAFGWPRSPRPPPSGVLNGKPRKLRGFVFVDSAPPLDRAARWTGSSLRN